jgi:hypothetical protein
MPITPDDPFLVRPDEVRISREQFRAVMRQMAAPAVLDERDPREYYDAILAELTEDGRCADPLLILAKFNKESTMGKSGMARTTHSWGNTRKPDFGPAPIGEETQFINGVENGAFSTYANWLDGCRSTCARLVAKNHVYASRRSIREIYEHPSNRVWAPAEDFNNPAGYLRAVIDFMNAHADRDGGERRAVEPVRLFISAGHWDTTGDNFNGAEKVRTRPLAIAIADEAERRGFQVTRQVDQFNGTHRDVADFAAKEAARQGIRLLFQVHFEGTDPTVRGAFCIPPHQPSRNDYDKDAERLGVDIVKRLKRATGMPIRGDGIMLETETFVKELAFFSRTAHLKANTERLLVEYGASNTNMEDRAIVDSPGFFEAAAQATVDAFEAFYDKQTARRRSMLAVKSVGLPENISTNPAAWHCAATNVWVVNPKFIDFYLRFGSDALMLFGLPISGEVGVQDDGIQTVQYFERARFEWHPDLAGTPHEVQLGRVGAELHEFETAAAAHDSRTTRTRRGRAAEDAEERELLPA